MIKASSAYRNKETSQIKPEDKIVIAELREQTCS